MKDKILIVDDIPDNVKLLTLDLQDADYEVVAASSGAQALELVMQHEINLILLDIMMPDMDGFEACRRLKKIPRICDIPVIMISAEGAEDEIIEGLAAGACDYISKPYRWSIVKARVEAALRVKHSHDDMKRAQREALRANQAKSQFLSHMSHELRTPLVALLGFSELGMDEKTTEREMRDYFRTINSSSGVLLHLINDLLDIAKVEAGKMHIHKSLKKAPKKKKSTSH